MPKYVYRYFPIKALGEGPRLLLSYGKEEFEDIRVNPDEWVTYKPKTLFGQMPTLEIDGKQYAQSLAISRYLGRKYGISGATPEEDLLIDQIVDFVNDIRAKAAIVHYEQDEALKEKKHKDFSVNLYPALLEKLDSIIADNNGHVALGKLTWGDFVLTGMLDYVKVMMRMPDLEEKYVNIKKVADNVVAIPQVKAYVDKAPKTEI
ncbi:Glutathione S-transferase 2 [Eumeta japonica]|uniref:glutathione transferase n=1 Tax=Eumeta variegata TaxID=151549 RepID=A0A4C1WXX7_EUMVA|nr:Glutathione S-transferase 2 [Eumeta japonica]